MSKFVIVHNSEEDTFDENKFMSFFKSNPTMMWSIVVNDDEIIISDEHIDGEVEVYAPYSDLLMWRAMGELCKYMKSHKG